MFFALTYGFGFATIASTLTHVVCFYGSPWTCPGDRAFFDASVIWGLVGPKCIFGSQGKYSAMNWFLLGGALGPAIVLPIAQSISQIVMDFTNQSPSSLGSNWNDATSNPIELQCLDFR
ncbi:Oligopeptide transporter 4 [Glycine soja]|uniref:Oligopeptide transporter 4 n=1 Tax=Glycine soja TaxID=3848 RepID=A0A0B2QCM0_GLYSO|nr:Oligopeptide transporter 4 [Glycine soja]